MFSSFNAMSPNLFDTVKACVQEPGFFNLALTGSYINGVLKANLDYQGS